MGYHFPLNLLTVLLSRLANAYEENQMKFPTDQERSIRSNLKLKGKSKMKFLKKAKANKENEINIEVKHDNTLGRKLIKETATFLAIVAIVSAIVFTVQCVPVGEDTSTTLDVEMGPVHITIPSETTIVTTTSTKATTITTARTTVATTTSDVTTCVSATEREEPIVDTEAPVVVEEPVQVQDPTPDPEPIPVTEPPAPVVVEEPQPENTEPVNQTPVNNNQWYYGDDGDCGWTYFSPRYSRPDYDIDSQKYHAASEYVSENDRILLCNIVGSEYGSDYVPIAEKAKVVAVVMNRLNNGYWGSSIESVLSAPYQFSGFWIQYSFIGSVTPTCIDAVDYYFLHKDESQYQGIMYISGGGGWNSFS